MKKNLFRALSALMCLIMVMGLLGGCGAPADSEDHDHDDELTGDTEIIPDENVPLQSGLCDGNHKWVNEGGMHGTDCKYGNVNFIQYKCSVCGVKYTLAIRAEDGDAPKGGEHNVEVQTYNSVCQNNPITQEYCTKCSSYYLYPSGGGHKWTEDKKDATCEEDGYIKRTCDCGAKEEETLKALGHVWVTETTEDGVKIEKCRRCGEVKNCNHIWSDWRSDSENHWLVCHTCGAKSGVDKHVDSNSDYVCDVCECQLTKPCQHEWKVGKSVGVLNHEEECTKCHVKVLVTCAAAGKTKERKYCTDPTYCECGNKVKDGQKNHNFGTWICNDDTHKHKCLNIGCSYGEEEPHAFVTVENLVMCSVCSFVDLEASAPHVHTFGPWTAGENGCVRYCTDSNCGESETTDHVPGTADCAGNATCTNCGATVKTTPSATHTGPTEVRGYTAPEVGKDGYTGDTYCLTCGQVVQKGQAIPALVPEHVHDYKTLCHDSTGHWYECECGERNEVLEHNGGTATCAEQAVCQVCGEKYGALDGNNHVGGTEILNAVPAEVGKEGYTGDVHCLGCGALLEKGQVIEALPETHTHSYTVKYDSTGHWQECECGDKQDIQPHDYVGGSCSVCGAEEPVKVVEPHHHIFSSFFESDSANHWLRCATCGAEAARAPHMFVNGRCTTCGMTVEDYENKVNEENEAAHNVVNIFPDVKSDDFYTASVQRMYDAKLMNGKSTADGKLVFDVTGKANRKEFMAVLARLNGVEGAGDPATWESASVGWCVKSGYADEGDVNAKITRQEIVTILWKLAGRPVVEYDLSSFDDASALEGEVLEAMKWAVANGIMAGRGTSIAPTADSNRGEIATFIVRYLDLVSA